MVVYLLWNVSKDDDEKLLGVFGSRELANELINKYIILPGFRDSSEFIIDEYTLNEEQWTEGFID